MKRFVLRAGRSPACQTLGASVKEQRADLETKDF